MFERVIASVLKGYVARYVDINADQLSVQLLYGRPIIVENLTFHKDALNNDIRTKLKLPIEIESLSVGKIQFSIVWKSFFFRSSSAAFIIEVHNVRATIKPINLDDYEDRSDEISEVDESMRKQSALELNEQQLEKEFEFFGEIKASSWSLKSLVLSFLEKIQVEIHNVDITYQSFTSDNKFYQFGLSFDSVKILNEVSNENMNVKSFCAKNLSIYVDSTLNENEHQANHEYILVPSNMIQVFLTHNYKRSSLINRHKPRFDVRWTFDDLTLKSSAEQIQIMSDVIQFFNYSKTHPTFLKDSSRPNVKISSSSAKSWWRYVILTLVRTQNYLRSPNDSNKICTTSRCWFNKSILEHRLKQLIIYKNLYRSYLEQKYLRKSNPNAVFPPTDRSSMKQIENEFDLESLINIRRSISRARARATEQSSSFRDPQQTNPTASRSSWSFGYAQWISGKVFDVFRQNQTENNATTQPTNVLINENDRHLEEQVNTFIAQSLEDEYLSRNRRDVVYLRFNIHLKSVGIDLIKRDEKIFNFSLSEVYVLTEVRPRHESFLLYVRLDDLNICDKTRSDTFSKIVYPKQRNFSSTSRDHKAPVFELSYEKNPPVKKNRTKRIGASIVVRSRGLCLVFSPLSTERLREFFHFAFVQPRSNVSNETTSIFNHWTQLKDRTRKRLKATFEQIFSEKIEHFSSSSIEHIQQGQRQHKKKFDIFLDICAPQIIIPQSSDQALTFDFGSLKFLNDDSANFASDSNNFNSHKSKSASPTAIEHFFNERPYFFNEEIRTTTDPNSNEEEEDQDDKDLEFYTPTSSPAANDGLEPVDDKAETDFPSTSEEENYPNMRNAEDLFYSSFSLSLFDMQLDISKFSDNQTTRESVPIIEKFAVRFFLQYRTLETFATFSPLIKISGTLPKLTFFLDPSSLESLSATIYDWSSFFENLTSTIVSNSEISNSTISQSPTIDLNARFTIGFLIKEVKIFLSDRQRKLSEIRIQQSNLNLLNYVHSNVFNFTLDTLMVFDALREDEDDFQFLLTSHRTLDINAEPETPNRMAEHYSQTENHLITFNITTNKNGESNGKIVMMDVEVNKLHFVFNPETLMILKNFITETLHEIRSIRSRYTRNARQVKPTVEESNANKFTINATFQELTILFTNVLTVENNENQLSATKLEKILAARLRQASLNASFDSSTSVRASISSLKMFNLLDDSKDSTTINQPCAIVHLGDDQTEDTDSFAEQALYISYTKSENLPSIEDLKVEMASLCYTHSPIIIYKIEQIFKYIGQNALKQGTILFNQLVSPNEQVTQNEASPRQFRLNISLATPILIFRPKVDSYLLNYRLVFHLGNIYIENGESQGSNYGIKVDKVHLFSIDLEQELRQRPKKDLILIYKDPILSLPILKNISIRLDLSMNDYSIAVDSKLVSSVQLFLGKHQITLLQNIISSLTYNENDEKDSALTEMSNEVDSVTTSNQDQVDGMNLVHSTRPKPFRTFAINFQLPKLILAFQAEIETKQTTVCEATFGEFMMKIEQKHQFEKTVSLRLNSLRLIDRLIKVDEVLFSTRCRTKHNSYLQSDNLSNPSSFSNDLLETNRNLSDSPHSFRAYNDSNNRWSYLNRFQSSTEPAFINIDISLVDGRHEDFSGSNIIANAQFGEVNLTFIISTWVLLLDIIGVIGGRPSPVPKNVSEVKTLVKKSDTDNMIISVHIEAVSCLLQDDKIPPIRISLQSLECQIQTFMPDDKIMKTLTVTGKLGSVSVRDLSQHGELYEERFCTSGTNALVFTYEKEERAIRDEASYFPARLKLYLRMTSVQYIHTQRFLMDVIHFFDRFHHSQDCYNRIRSAEAGETTSWQAGRSTGIELDVEAQTPILILPEYSLNKPVIILHLGNISVNNKFLHDNEPGTLSVLTGSPTASKCLLDVISVHFKDTILYSATYCKLDSNRKVCVRFSSFGFYRENEQCSSMLREQSCLRIQIERNLENALSHASPTFSVKADLSSVDIVLDTAQYSLVRGILAYNIGEQLEQPSRAAMMVEDPKCVSTALTGDVYVDIRFIIEMDNVGFHIFVPLHSLRTSLGYCAFSKSKFSLEKYSNNHTTFNLNCSSIKLEDTRYNSGNQFRNILTSSPSMINSTSQMQLEIQLSTSKTNDSYVIVLNHTKILFIVDWLLKFADFLNSFQQVSIPTNNTISVAPVLPPKKIFELRLNFNQCELFLVQTTDNERSNALVLSGAITLVYRESQIERPLYCESLSFSLYSCQMHDIRSTAVAIIEPSRITFNIHLSKNEQQRIFEFNLPQLFVRLSYSDIKVMFYMFQSIREQIDHAKAREILPKYSIKLPRQRTISRDEFIMEYCSDNQDLVDFRIRPADAPNISLIQNQDSVEEEEQQHQQKENKETMFNVHTMKFIFDQISLCLIDDCLNANIPLLNLTLSQTKLSFVELETHRIQQVDFQLSIDYYNRLLSGYEPFVESWPLRLILKASTAINSLVISSNHVLNINYTKTMHQLFDLVKSNWIKDYNNTNELTKRNMYFRPPKPFEPYCFKNLVGQRVRFQAFLSQKAADRDEHVVEYDQQKSFTFPSDPSRLNANRNKEASTSAYSDRRLSIIIEGWEPLQPISIDRVGTLFRLAKSSTEQQKFPVLVFIDIKMTQDWMRFITIRSAIEIENNLLTPIDLRLKCNYSALHDIRLESNETRSLPLRFCPSLSQIQVRPSDFDLNYCSEPITWSHIVSGQPKRRIMFQDEQESTTDSSDISSNHDDNTMDRQSFFRTCTMGQGESIYFLCIQSRRKALFPYRDQMLCSYQLSFLSPLIVNNLLPCDLFFQIDPNPQKVRLGSYKSHREHHLDIRQAIDLVLATDLYHMKEPLRLPSINNLTSLQSYRKRVPLYDSVNRIVLFDVAIVCSLRNRLKIIVSIPYVLLNQSGIPLVFKQEGTSHEAAGQTYEHQMARNREPLLFSFSDSEAALACTMKVGRGLHENDDGIPIWSSPFRLERGSSYRQLHVRSPHGVPDWIYYIGIDIRQGKGRLRRTNFIFLSTRYMISNQCSYDLSIAQRHIVRAMQQTGDHSNVAQKCLYVLKNSNVPYHWPRSDLDQLLCVRVINNPQYKHAYWSGGFLIGCVNAFHINLRYNSNQCLILRVQVVERGGTFFVVFMDANQMPAPLRIKNLSDVPIQFYQSQTREELTYLRAFVQPNESIDYAWDEITLNQTITCSVLGGTEETYDLQKLGPGENLCYENHIFLAMEKTFEDSPSKKTLLRSQSVSDRDAFTSLQRQQLVIDYINGKLVLARLEENKRSQLWRMTSSGVLVHTGSSSPRDWRNKEYTPEDIRRSCVLDIEESSGNSSRGLHLNQSYTRLTIRRYDPNRRSTQTWRLHDNGYLQMGEHQKYVQVVNELKENNELVVGSGHLNDGNRLLDPIPRMFIRPHRRLKGSGLLSVRTYADGPTRVLEISDVKSSNSVDTPKNEATTRDNSEEQEQAASSTVYSVELRLESGIGLSVISSVGHESEELMYMIFNDIYLKYVDREDYRSVDSKIGAIIVSNQLVTTSTPCLMYATFSEESAVRAAVCFTAILQKSSANYKKLYIFRNLNICLNGIMMQMDEILLWKLMDFLGIGFTSSTARDGKKYNPDDQICDFNEGQYDTQRLLSLLTSTQATRIYFNELVLSSVDLNLSVHCGSSRSLPTHLLMIKRRSPFPLIRFENAQIHLKAYEQTHVFNTYDFFLIALSNHYVNEMKRQAFRILGSVDFLGNPLGLFNDVTDGFASLVDHGSVTGLVKNVAHGFADSVSKFSGTLSYGLGKLTWDEDHDDMREAISENYRGSTLGHVFGGTVGLAVGVIGGLTSMITQPYKGVVEEGVSGLAKGFVKGIIGTVSKPAVGILDFANGLALAVKEGARSSNSILRSRIRSIRAPTNMFGLLQPFSQEDADGQQLLILMRKSDPTERYIGRTVLSQTPTAAVPKRKFEVMNDEEFSLDRRRGRIHAMITSQRVIIYRTDIKQDESDYEWITEYHFNNLDSVLIKEDKDNRAHLQFFLHSQSRRSTSLSTKNENTGQFTVFRCDLHERASRLTADILRAKDLFEEERSTYCSVVDEENGDENEDITDEPINDAPARND